MEKYLNQTTVNVVAIVTAVVAGLSLVSGPEGPSRAMREQMLENRKLDYSMGRIRACGELKRYGVSLSPQSPDVSLCSDVIVVLPVLK